MGELNGSGSVVSGGDVCFEGKSELKPDPEIGLAIYAQGNINLNRINVKEAVNDPSNKFKEAFANFIIDNKGPNIKELQPASRTILDTLIHDGKNKKTLRDVLAAQFGYDSSQAQNLALKLLTKNTIGDGISGYAIIAPNSAGWCDVVPRDSNVKGIIYTWKNFNADVDGGSLTLRGAVVAYGGDPGSQEPGEGSADGEIHIKGSQCFNLIYDPNYFAILGEDVNRVVLKRVLFNQI